MGFTDTTMITGLIMGCYGLYGLWFVFDPFFFFFLFFVFSYFLLQLFLLLLLLYYSFSILNSLKKLYKYNYNHKISAKPLKIYDNGFGRVSVSFLTFRSLTLLAVAFFLAEYSITFRSISHSVRLISL